MRLFVAVEIGVAARLELARTIEELARRVGESAPRARVTWVKPDALHVTVRFIGEVDREVAADLEAALQPPLPIEPFALHLQGTGTFPSRQPPRVVWAGIAAGIEPLRSVEREVRARVDPLVRGDDRDYHPHVTLGRVKVAAGLRPAVLLDGLETQPFGVTAVGAVTLFESRLSSKGPTYVPRVQAKFLPIA